MILYCSRNRFMLFKTLIRHKTFETIKSRHDEQNNQVLLGRLKNIAVIGESKKEVQPPSKVSGLPTNGLPERRLTCQKLMRLVTYYQSDPLTWSPSVLGRIYRIPEDYCYMIVNHVAPMIFYMSRTYEEPLQITQQGVVVDVARLQTDAKYLTTYQKISFPERNEKLPPKALDI